LRAAIQRNLIDSVKQVKLVRNCLPCPQVYEHFLSASGAVQDACKGIAMLEIHYFADMETTLRTVSQLATAVSGFLKEAKIWGPARVPAGSILRRKQKRQKTEKDLWSRVEMVRHAVGRVLVTVMHR
jgi:hypothetical protein